MKKILLLSLLGIGLLFIVNAKSKVLNIEEKNNAKAEIKETCRTRSFQACKVNSTTPGQSCEAEPGTCKKLMPCTALPTIPVNATPYQIEMIATNYVNNLISEDYICLEDFQDAKAETISRINLYLSTGE